MNNGRVRECEENEDAWTDLYASGCHVELFCEVRAHNAIRFLVYVKKGPRFDRSRDRSATSKQCYPTQLAETAPFQVRRSLAMVVKRRIWTLTSL